MPLVGDPSLAFLLYGPSVSFAVHAAISTAAPAVNQTQVVAEQEANQLSMNTTLPRIMYLAFGGVVLIVMIISHPRFLARLFASIPSQTCPRSRTRPSLGYRLLSKSQENGGRAVGGGDLREGWILKKGSEKNIELVSPCTSGAAKPLELVSPNDERQHMFLPPPPHPFLSPPPHIIPLLSYLPFSSSLLFTPLYCLPGIFKSLLTLSKLYVIVGYLILIVFALVWRSDLSDPVKGSGYGSDFKRSGTVAMVQMPLVIALGVRGNIIGLCIGKGYERLKLYHKVVGRVMFAAASVHVWSYVYSWVSKGTFKASATRQFVIYGILTYTAFLLIIISSLPWFRKAFYGIFKICHFVGMIGTLVGMAWHVDKAVPFCITALVFYLVSIVCSLAKTRLATAELHALPRSETTIVTIPALRTGWRAGQHVRIRVPGLGLRYGFEAHPFTIASAPNGEGMVLMCKGTGDWTKNLLEFAKDLKSGAPGSESGRNKSVTVILEGPWGGLGNTIVPSFSSVVLVAGGSGISHALTIAHDLVTRSPTGCVRARLVDLVWMVKTEQEAKPLMATLLELVGDARKHEMACIESSRRDESYIQPTALRARIFVTRCPVSSPLNLIPNETGFFDFQEDYIIEDKANLRHQPSTANEEKASYLARNPSAASTMTAKIRKNLPYSMITANPARPNLDNLLDNIARETIIHHGRNMTDPSGMYVAVSGPHGLVHGTMMAVRKLSSDKRIGVGEIEFEQECFGF
ncbi:uncharacterized protein L203_100513 [Cryptococcus depauperatus CBS 7841]|uniref:ferric-chelate reductase (NADPH) n=1 Tax=Cryptococcus depauperatus CBS 7841 TaxID=1295531 RepID=A0AAJ8JN65_9TREE